MLGIEPVVFSSEFEPGNADGVRVLVAISLSVLLLIWEGGLSLGACFGELNTPDALSQDSRVCPKEEIGTLKIRTAKQLL